jgi:hypothetical protein
MPRLKTAVVLLAVLFIAGCTPLERQAYNTVVAAKGFLDSEKQAHPECATGATSTVCVDIAKAVQAKDLLISALEVYCAGPQFESGGVCQAPAKGTPAYEQAAAKLQAAIDNYNRISSELKGLK